MYTTVPHHEANDHRPKPGEPLPEIIDHRKGYRINKYRSENLPYETLKKQRDEFLEDSHKYKKLAKELEKQKADLVVSYEDAYQENKQLKSIIEHGPDAVKVKQFKKENKEQKKTIERLNEENKALHKRLKDIEKLNKRLRDAEKNPWKNSMMTMRWKDSLESVRRLRAREAAERAQGPFLDGNVVSNALQVTDDGYFEDIDSHDLQLDYLEKESQKVLNKIKQLKREKLHIDYSVLMGQSANNKTPFIANAMSRRLSNDLDKYSSKLEQLKLQNNRAKQHMIVYKHESAKQIYENLEAPPSQNSYRSIREKKKQLSKENIQVNKTFPPIKDAKSTAPNSSSRNSAVSFGTVGAVSRGTGKTKAESLKEVGVTVKRKGRPQTFSDARNGDRQTDANKQAKNDRPKSLDTKPSGNSQKDEAATSKTRRQSMKEQITAPVQKNSPRRNINSGRTNQETSNEEKSQTTMKSPPEQVDNNDTQD